LALNGGSIHSISTGGLKISRSIFTTPPHVLISNMNHSFEPEILLGIVDCIEQQTTEPQSSALLRSLRSFSMAYKNSHDMDNASRVLSMIMAFELLFGENGRANFRKNILKYSEEYSPSRYPYNEINTQTGNIIRQCSLTGIQIWAEEFYKLRHRIIHADIVISSDYVFKDMNSRIFNGNNSHIALAFETYAVCLTNKLREMGKTTNYHLMVTEKKNRSITDRNLMNIQNKEFTIVDRRLHDALQRLTTTL
jgi:hypothetical protein